jgi:hypothetical protein
VGSVVAVASLAACGGIASEAHDQGRMDAAASSHDGGSVDDRDASPFDVPDASVTCSRGCLDATSSASDEEGGRSIVVTDAPRAATELCHVVWPQTMNYLEIGTLQMAVDTADNSYLAVSYNGPRTAGSSPGDAYPAIDLGVPSAGYRTGVAVAKVDLTCHVVWMRELGTPTYSPTRGEESYALAVDVNSNVTLTGSVSGATGLGIGALDAGSADAGSTLDDADSGTGDGAMFIVRFDANGELVFSNVLSNVLPAQTLGVDSNGVSTLIVSGGNGPGVSEWVDGGPLVRNEFLVQFDGTGNILSQRVLPYASFIDLFSSPGGDVWAWSREDADGGPTPSMVRLDSNGEPASSIPFPSGSGSPIAVNAAGEFGAYAESNYTDTTTDETVWTFASDGAVMSHHTSTVDYEYSDGLAWQMALGVNGLAIVGGVFDGTLGSGPDTPQIANGPVGVGFQAFDGAGVLRSLGVWSGANESFGSVGIAPDGSVSLCGWTRGPVPYAASDIFFARYAP